MTNAGNRSVPALCAIILLFMSPAACAAPEAGNASSPLIAASSIPMLENGEFCSAADLMRMDSDGNIEELDAGDAHLLSKDGAPSGTWIYMGRSARGFVKAIVQQGASTKLPEANFNTALEIHPKTHPVDVRPSGAPMDRDASFSFTVLSKGEPVKAPVRYTASRLGRTMDPATGTALAEDGRETMMGEGRIRIDEPGTWWITAEQDLGGEGNLSASLTFHVPEIPGPDHYSAFTREGIYLVDPAAIAEHLRDAEVIFLGEQHDDPVAHLLEREILEAVHALDGRAALSLEMFERDVQAVMDGYLKGLYMEDHFLGSARPWPRYATDYRPMVEYAKENGVPVIAANAPRRLVNLVSRKGPETLADLPEGELRWLPPLPYHIPQEGRYVEKLQNVFSGFARTQEKEKGADLPGPRMLRDWKAKGYPDLAAYNRMLNDAEGPEGGGPPSGMPAHAMMRLAGKKGGNPSQSLWDASMAYSIAGFLDRHPKSRVVHVNGAFHSDEHLGTVEQLLRYRPGTKVAVVSMLPDASFPSIDLEEHGPLGDVIIITDPSWQPDD